VTVGALAERLQVRHHTVVALVDRLVDRGFVRRRRNPANRRKVLIELAPAGEKVLETLVLFSLRELQNEGPALVATLKRLVRNSTAVHRRPARRQKG
jgi:DNA-binding MarR family transcriptional regulator